MSATDPHKPPIAPDEPTTGNDDSPWWRRVFKLCDCAQVPSGRAAPLVAGGGVASAPAQPISDAAIGAFAFRLALDPALWVHRRVETFEFVDAVTVRRQMSVDFTLPADAGIPEGQIVILPLMLLAKRDLRHFSLVDDVGGALPALSTSQNAAISAEGIKNLLVAYGGKLDGLTSTQEAAITAVVSAPDAEAGHALLEEATGCRGVLRDALAGITEPANRREIDTMLATFAGSFLLLTMLPFAAGQRRIVKCAYDARIKESVRGSTFWKRRLFDANRILSSFGLVGRLETFEDLLVGLADSYHVEVIPPGDTYAIETTLEIQASLEDPRIDRHPFRPHLHLSPSSQGDIATLSVLLRAQREPLVAPLLVIDWIIAATLWFAGSEAAKGRLDGASLAALLLVPFALAAFYVRGAENTYVTEMLRGVRIAALLPILAGVFVIATLALGFLKLNRHHDEISRAAFESVHVCRWVAAIAAAYLALVFIAPEINRAYRGPVRKIQAWARNRAREKERATSGNAGASAGA